MKYVALPDQSVRRLSFYLAMEEYVARNIVDDDDLFFMWQVRPTVIFGRHQDMESEVNVPYCREHGIELYRRKSGGGCVYADMGNVMTSFVANGDNVGLIYNRYINMLVLVLRRLGAEASASGRNDVTVSGRKVSGTAYCQLTGRAIVHGTMLFDTTMENMVNAITPPMEKLQRNGVQSVSQRIGFLKDYVSVSPGEFIDYVRRTQCTDVLTLTPDDVAGIEAIEQDYLDPDFIMGRQPDHPARQ